MLGVFVCDDAVLCVDGLLPNYVLVRLNADIPVLWVWLSWLSLADCFDAVLPNYDVNPTLSVLAFDARWVFAAEFEFVLFKLVLGRCRLVALICCLGWLDGMLGDSTFCFRLNTVWLRESICCKSYWTSLLTINWINWLWMFLVDSGSLFRRLLIYSS